MKNKIERWMKNKKASFVQDNLGWLLLGLAVLVVVIGSFFFFNKTGTGALNYIKNLFRFRG